MPEPTVVHHTFVVERSYPVSPDRVFAAFADPVKKRRWFVDSPSKIVEEYSLDFRAGGSEVVRYRADMPFPNTLFINDIHYEVILPGKRIVFANTMAMGDHIFSAALATVDLLPTDTGTDLIFTHQGAFFEGADGPHFRELGWRKLLEQLGAELEQSELHPAQA